MKEHYAKIWSTHRKNDKQIYDVPKVLYFHKRGKIGRLFRHFLENKRWRYAESYMVLCAPHAALWILHATRYTGQSSTRNHPTNTCCNSKTLTLYIFHFIRNITLYTIHFHTPHSTLHTLHFSSALHTPHPTLHTQHPLHSTLHTQHSTRYTSHAALHTPISHLQNDRLCSSRQGTANDAIRGLRGTSRLIATKRRACHAKWNLICSKWRVEQ